MGLILRIRLLPDNLDLTQIKGKVIGICNINRFLRTEPMAADNQNP
mgnify:CR=1 FL=1